MNKRQRKKSVKKAIRTAIREAYLDLVLSEPAVLRRIAEALVRPLRVKEDYVALNRKITRE